MFKCLHCMFAEKRFLICFGVLYAMSVITLLHKTSVMESDMDLIEAEKVTLRRHPRLPSDDADSNVTTSKQKQLSGQPTPKKSDGVKQNIPSGLIAEIRQAHVVSSGLVGSKLDCQKLPAPVFLQPGTMPLTALHSFPGSGNTWVRVLLASLTGLNTGDIYRDGAFAKTPGFSYKKDDTVIAVKTHHPFWDDNNGPDPSAPKGRYWERAVIVIRHPLDATVSVYNWFRMRGSHTKAATLDKYLGKDGKPTKEWNKWAHDQIRNWGRCIDYWINVFKGPKVVVFYEDLIVDLKKNLMLMNEFLGVDLDERRLECTLQSQAQQKFHRKNPIDKRILYDSSMLSEVEAVLEMSRQILAKNYTHIQSGFRIPDNYAVSLIKENFSVKPNISSNTNPS